MYSRFFFALACTLACSVNATDEGLALRRIADFWEEGEYHIAKSQMEEFLIAYPESSYANVLSRALGDLFLREKNYKAALDHYSQLADQEEIFLNRLQCLYHLEWHATLADECEAYLKKEGPHKLQATYFLAIALYSQALSADHEASMVFAERAKPYFESLSKSELSDEVAGAFAHLRCLLKDFDGASKIYLELADKHESNELLFQAALMQSKFDKNLALETFDKIQEGDLASESFYNRLVLFFDQGRFEEIIEGKENWYKRVPVDKIGLAHLFVGQSHLSLKQYAEASVELNVFLDSEVAEEKVRPALIHLVEAGYESGDLNLLDQAISRLSSDDSHLPNALFSRALLLKKEGKFEEAREQLKALPVVFAEKPQVTFELAQIERTLKNWSAARDCGLKFFRENPSSDLSPFAWDIAAHATLELALAPELEELLKEAPSSIDRASWAIHLGKVYYDLGSFTKVIELTKDLEQADAQLLCAICLQKTGDEAGFCAKAEKALAGGATLMPAGSQHLSLYNSFLSQNLLEKASEHLFGAFEQKIELQMPNLLWLANFSPADKAYKVLLHIESDLTDPQLLFRLGKLHHQFGHEAEAISVLEKVPTNEAKLALAEILLRKGDLSKAEALFDAIAASDTFRDEFAASAALQGARLKLAASQKEVAAILFKDLAIQKNIKNEPIHLEAAIEYADLQTDKEKRLSLLKKTKADFESEEDLLSKDYHAARKQLSEQNEIYLGYMQLLDAEIFLAESELSLEDLQRKELQTKAKEILLQIKCGAQSPLVSRAEKLLEK